MTNSITTTCSNCGKVAELGRPIPVVAEDGSTFEIAVCDSEACQTNCIPTHPTDFITLALSGQRITRRYGPCDECEFEYSVDELIAGKTEGYDTPWYCVYCYGRLQRNDTATKVLLQILKGNKNMMTITRDGIETIENIVTEVDSTLTSDEKFEFVLWSDASLTIDGIMTESAITEHVALNLESMRQLRDFLNSPRITEMLANQ